jgi:hypothetical protein
LIVDMTRFSLGREHGGDGAVGEGHEVRSLPKPYILYAVFPIRVVRVHRDSHGTPSEHLGDQGLADFGKFFVSR